VAAYQTWIKLRLQHDPEFKSSCNVGEALNCDAVMTSAWSEIAGIPISLLAIPTYLVVLYFLSLALRGALERGRSFAPSLAKRALRNAFVLGLATVGYSIFLFFISKVKLETYCIFCIALYVVNIGSTVAIAMARRESLPDMLRGWFGDLIAIRPPILSSLTVVMLSSVVVFGGYATISGSMVGDQMGDIDALFTADFEEEEPGAPSAAPVVVAAPAASSSSGPPKALPTPKRARPKGKMTDNGLTYYEAQLYDDDWAKGGNEAKVTVVKFADFECAYCRYMDLNVRPLVKKYGDKVRWVMKHYPMNADCNPRMGSERMHPQACVASYGAHCAGKQGKFWEMHDKLYDSQSDLKTEGAPRVRLIAESLALDMGAYDACLKSPDTSSKIRRDIQVAARAGISGTPRAYVNGRLVSGSGSTQILDYYIQKSFEEVEAGGGTGAVAAAPGSSLPAPKDAPSMVQAKSNQGAFWIDAFEASIAGDGRAMSLPGVAPAQASWFEAKDACEKAGKRLCSEEEWVSACSGTPAEDNNNNGFFADDDVEGRMYPYGIFYEKGNCRDSEDESSGRPTKTAQHRQCVTPDGIYDLAGNLMEWVEFTKEKAALAGGDWRGGERSACNRRTKTFGPGQRNSTIGFRCCADQQVSQKAVAEAELKKNESVKVGRPLPAFDLKTADDKTIGPAHYKGKVTYLTFFASWCGSCKRELPELNNWVKAYGAQGFQVVAVGVDRNEKQSLAFAEKFEPIYPITLDPEATVMGLFDVDAMPTSFIVDRKGVVRHREVGFKKDEVSFMQKRLQKMLKE
jgi:protein-disulfide isomerase/uncharacterized membrane protein